jgi:tRNA-specific 2-thiouridylase
MEKKLTVFVGVSGGVDSSVAAALLKDQGYNVVGVFIRTWTPDFIECTWRDERRDAMRVCAHLGIPFLECDAEEAYKKNVADYMIEEYKKGNTPNPDVMCNREVKFGVFWDFAKKRGADFIATGHYARVLLSQGSLQSSLSLPRSARRAPTPVAFQGPCELHTGVDRSKDQVYFLWILKQEDLEHTLFPIGHLEKTDVRKKALKYNIPVAAKKDSQGVCFLGPLDMKDFLKHYIKSEEGKVLNVNGPACPHDNSGAGGEIIGTHDGAVFFTLGERHGFRLMDNTKRDEPLYVVSKDIKNNTITVSARPCLADDSLLRRTVLCSKTNWINDIPKKDHGYKAQIRYHGELLNCKIMVATGQTCKISFEKDVLVDKGQSIVVFDGEVCLGGGVVE